jgi:hypothetical protein
VLLIIGSVVLGVLLGLALGGSIRNLDRLRLRWWGLALIGLALQLAPVGSSSANETDWLAAALLGLSFISLFVFLAANFRVAGVPLVTLGIALNALAIGLNGGMPVSDSALRSAYTDPVAYRTTKTVLIHQGPPKHHLAEGDTLLRPITDVIGLGPPVEQVFSAGDLIAMAGIVWLLAAATRGEPGRRSPGRRRVARRSELERPTDSR